MTCEFAPRGSGKTARLIQRLLEEPNTVLLVADERRRAFILRELSAKETSDPHCLQQANFRVLAFSDWRLARLTNAGPTPILLIDQLEDCLAALLGTMPAHATFTSPEGGLGVTLVVNRDQMELKLARDV